MKRRALLLGSMVSLFVGGLAGAQPVVFNDANLKALVESTLGISDPNAADMQKLTTLDGYAKGITDLTGLETATHIERLHLYSFEQQPHP